YTRRRLRLAPAVGLNFGLFSMILTIICETWKNQGVFFHVLYFNITNKDRLCERSEPQSYPVVGQARHGKQGSYIKANIFFDSGGI
ncbi:MAG: hypothetical protein KJP06_06720, partial [Deltaproteobacteria bacterium]|nr:hypothetical protein [Deltaproteobacteria bacterium]